jgi:hypothetical protein
VFFFNISENIYYLLKLASSPILALEFVHSRPSHLLVSSDNGLVSVIDTISKDVIKNLYLLGSEPILMMRCSLDRPLAVFISVHGNIVLWDLRYV